MVKTEWDNNIFIIIYKRGLKKNIKDKLIKIGLSLKILNKL